MISPMFKMLWYKQTQRPKERILESFRAGVFYEFKVVI